VGIVDGTKVGTAVGALAGTFVCADVGIPVGSAVVELVGKLARDDVGIVDGTDVGPPVGILDGTDEWYTRRCACRYRCRHTVGTDVGKFAEALAGDDVGIFDGTAVCLPVETDVGILMALVKYTRRHIRWRTWWHTNRHRCW
jgi:hypothetical protein